jgi:3-mercaptopyruvate sulfurtransferase SseA
MAVAAIFTCVCGVQKKTSNHWILATRSAETIRFVAWDWNLATSDNVVVLCGEGCAAALLSRSLGMWKQAA